MKKDKVYTLCDTTYIAEYSEYVENCEANEIEPMGEDSDDYWDFVSHCQELEVEDLETNLKYSKQANTPVLLTGTLGLWNGHPEIYPIYFKNVMDAISYVAGRVDGIKVEYCGGVVTVYGYHHDGTNCFEVHKLSERGNNVCSKWGIGRSNNTEVKGYWLAKFHGFLY